MYVIFVHVSACMDPLFIHFECYPCCWRNYGCVWSITERKCHGSSQIHIFVYAWSMHVCIRIGKRGQEKATSTTTKIRLVENLNALATCCAIEFVFCTCGWCVNSLRLQIQVIFNTSSLLNWNLFRNECACVSVWLYVGYFFLLSLVYCLQKLKWLLISCTYLFSFWQRKTYDERWDGVYG